MLNFEKVITLKEQYLYGSKRLGVRKPHLQLAAAPHTAVGYQTPNEPQAPGGWFNNDCMCYTYEEPVPVGGTPPPPANTTFTARFYTHTLGKKEYELTNHLGNVLATVLDRKTGVKASPTATTYAWFKADVTTAQDYYPFGSLMPGRTYVAPTGVGYRFGFGGKERVDKINGEGNTVDFSFRIFSTLFGRFLSVDPLAPSYPSISPFVFAENDVIRAIDFEGLEKFIVVHRYNDSGEKTSISVARIVNIEGELLENRILINGTVRDQKVMVSHILSNGKQFKDSEFNTELSIEENNVLEKGKTQTTPIGENTTMGFANSTVEFKQDGSKLLVTTLELQNEPELRGIKPKNGVIQFSQRVDFARASSALRNRSATARQLQDVADYLVQNPTASVFVAGNVNVGTNPANWNTGVGDGRSLGQLAEARARSVSQVLISDLKVNPTQVRFGRGNIVNGRQGQSTTFRINTGGTGQ